MICLSPPPHYSTLPSASFSLRTTTAPFLVSVQLLVPCCEHIRVSLWYPLERSVPPSVCRHVPRSQYSAMQQASPSIAPKCGAVLRRSCWASPAISFANFASLSCAFSGPIHKPSVRGREYSQYNGGISSLDSLLGTNIYKFEGSIDKRPSLESIYSNNEGNWIKKLARLLLCFIYLITSLWCLQPFRGSIVARSSRSLPEGA